MFDIQQGVAIALLVKRSTRAKSCTVRRADLWGTRAEKYAWLAAQDVSNTLWEDVTPAQAPWLFLKQDADLLTEYQQGWSVADIFRPNGDPAPGVVTTQDDLAISWTREEAIEKVERLLATASEAEAREIFTLCSQSQWNYERAKRELADGSWRAEATPILYRPFDVRWTIWNSNIAVHRRERVNSHLLKSNIALLLPKQTKNSWGCLATRYVAAHKSASVYDPTSIIPLWLYQKDDANLLYGENSRIPNMDSDFLCALHDKLKSEPTPEDIFAYLYAVLYAPSYRTRYAEFLRRDFPRVPITSDPALFKKLVALGQELIELHLLRRVLPAITGYPKGGSNRIDKIEFRPDPDNPEKGRVQINAEQYFEGMPRPVWEYMIGGYQVAHKWLKDRKGRLLTFDELQHYGRVVAALNVLIPGEAAHQNEVMSPAVTE